MSHLDYKPITRRRRPHIHPLDATLFLTFRLAGSIPQAIVRNYKEKRKHLTEQLRRARSARAQDPDSSELQLLAERIETHQREWFLKSEEILHRATHGPTWLKDESVARKVVENLHRLDGEAFRLDAFSVMSNHVHTVFKPLLSTQELEEMFDEDLGFFFVTKHPGLAKIMQLLKGRTSRECNLILGRSGSFWEHESFDHVIRSGKFDKTIRYVLNNPVKIHLVDNWQDWPWNYCRKELVERFT